MNAWVYSQADRCSACGFRAILPNREVAERFSVKSDGRLGALECPVGNGWHLIASELEFSGR